VPHTWPTSEGYDTSDSEHEQLDWRGLLGDKDEDESSSDDSSGGDTDEGSIHDRAAAFELRRKRLEQRERGRDRRTHIASRRKAASRWEEVQRR
jgi:hypothetical protein